MGMFQLPDGHLTIKGATPKATSVAVMQFYVGFALSAWHFVEQDLTMAYLALSCPANTPVDGALASFSEIQTIDAKANHVSKVLAQVLYQDEFTDFRKEAKRKLNRIVTLNGTRNKLAHGTASANKNGDPVFEPLYNFAHAFRYNAYRKLGPVPGLIVPPTQWTEADVRKRVQELLEGPELSHDLVRELKALFEDEYTTLQTARRMTLDLGIPYDPSPPNTPQQEGK